MRKIFQYRIFPTKKQVKTLNDALEECRWLYNHLLEKRRDAWEQEGKSLSLYQQQEIFSILKGERPSLKTVHSHDRDLNASKNILALGLQGLGLSREVPGFSRGE